MHEQWTKKYYGNHCTVQFCTVQFCFEIKHVMALFWNQANRYACLGISECKMFGWVTHPWLCTFCCRMLKMSGTSSLLCRGILQGCGPDNGSRMPSGACKMVGELRARLLDVLAPRMQVWWGRIGLWRKLHVCHMVQCCRMIVVCVAQCVACCRWTMHRLPNWKNFALELFHRARSGSVVLCRKCQLVQLRFWLLRSCAARCGGRHIHDGNGQLLLPVAVLHRGFASWHRHAKLFALKAQGKEPSTKCNEKGVIRAIMICIRLRAFVILCLQTEKVVQLRSSTASRYRAYLWILWDLICLRQHVRSSTSWYGAVFLGNLSWYSYMLVWQFLLRMPWRRAGNSSGSTASWHRVSACNSVSHFEVSTQLDLSAPVVEGIVACCTCRLKQWPVVVHLHFVAAGGSFVLALCLHCRRSRGLRINDL